MIEKYEEVYVSDREWKHLEEPYLSNFQTQRRNYRKKFAAIIEEGIAKNEIRKIDAPTAVLIILHAISGIESWHRSRAKINAQELEDNMVMIMIDGLQKDFNFKQGQSLSMRTTINNEEVRRTYSICSSPLDNEWKVAIKKVDGGLFSSFANSELKKGDVLEVMQPVGKFYVELNPANTNNYLGFAAGSGITPVLSIIKTTLRTEPNSSFTLVYGNKNRHSIIFFEELEGLKNKYLDRFNLINILSRERTDATINFGRINTEKLTELEKLVDYASFDEAFVCGPEEMIFCVKDFLEAKGIDKKKIHFELFTTPGQKKSIVNSPPIADQRVKYL